jgi:hypothetical protein
MKKLYHPIKIKNNVLYLLSSLPSNLIKFVKKHRMISNQQLKDIEEENNG